MPCFDAHFINYNLKHTKVRKCLLYNRFFEMPLEILCELKDGLHDKRFEHGTLKMGTRAKNFKARSHYVQFLARHR